MFEVIINNQALDGVIDEDIAITKALNNLNDLKSRSGDFSSVIKTHKTRNNSAIVENAEIIGSESNSPYLKYSATITAAGIGQINGFAVLESVDEFYNWRIYGGNSEIFALIKGKNIREINLSRFDHLWQDTEIIDNRTNYVDWNDCYIYPDIDYGQLTSAALAPTLFPNFFPSVHAKLILWQIALEAGYVPSGDFWENNELFSAEILPFVGGSPKFPEAYRNARKLKLNQIGSDLSIPVSGGNVTNQVIKLNTNDSGWGTYSSSTGIFGMDEVSFDMDFRFSATIEVDRTAIIGTPPIRVTITLKIFNQSNVLQKEFAYTRNDFGTTTQVFEVDFSGIFKFSGDEAYMTITITTTGATAYIISACRIKENAQVNYSLGESGYPGCPWIVAGNLPDISQSDFLSTIMNQYGLIVDCNPLLKEMKLIQFDELQNNMGIAPDWSSKIVTTSKPKISFRLNDYARRNKLQYIYDENDQWLKPREAFGMGLILVDDENLENEKVVFESKFAPVWFGPSFGGSLNICQIEMFRFSKENSIKPRIAYLSITDITATNPGIDIQKDQSSDKSNFVFGLGGGGTEVSARKFDVLFDKFRFDTNLIPSYYKVLSQMLEKCKIIEVDANISSFDFSQIRHDIPVFINVWIDGFGQLDGYFYLNIVKQKKVNRIEPTKVELVRI